MIELMPYYKKETNAEYMERITRERVLELHWRIMELKTWKELDMKKGDGHPLSWNNHIRMATDMLNLNIRLRIILGFPKIER